MTRYATWIALAFAVSLAGCQTSAPASVCDGWRRVPVTAAGAVKLVGDPDLRVTGESIAGHNAFGRKQGCWK